MPFFVFQAEIVSASLILKRKGLIPKNRETLDIEYLFYNMQETAPLIVSMGTGSTVKGIRTGELAGINIPLPPLEEQKRIAETLSKAEELKKLREEADRKTEELIPAIFHEMFGDPANNESKIRRSTLKEIGLKIIAGKSYSTDDEDRKSVV